MQVKGTAVKSTRDFMRDRFSGVYEEWVSSLPKQSKSIYQSVLNASAWYPFVEGYKIPVNKIVKLCYCDNPREGCEQLGCYCAEKALKGVYSIFLDGDMPQCLIYRATKICETYFFPNVFEAKGIDKNALSVTIKIRDEIDENLEYRVAGWAKKALELANCKETSYTINRSHTQGADYTEILFSWQ